MKSKEIIRLAIRLIGLVGLLYTCRHIYVMIHKIGSWHLGWLVQEWDRTGRADMGEVRALVFEILLILFGLYLLRGAPLVIKFMFPEEKKDAADQNADPKG